jgi:hypothetical protein
MVRAVQNKFWIKVTPEFMSDASNTEVESVNTKRRHSPGWRSQGDSKIITFACDCCAHSHFSILIATKHFTILIVTISTPLAFLIIHAELNRLIKKLDKRLGDAAKKTPSNCRAQPHVYGEPAAGRPLPKSYEEWMLQPSHRSHQLVDPDTPY